MNAESIELCLINYDVIGLVQDCGISSVLQWTLQSTALSKEFNYQCHLW